MMGETQTLFWKLGQLKKLARPQRPRYQGDLPTPSLSPAACQPWLLHQLPTVPTRQAVEGPSNLPSVATGLGHCLRAGGLGTAPSALDQCL